MWRRTRPQSTTQASSYVATMSKPLPASLISIKIYGPNPPLAHFQPILQPAPPIPPNHLLHPVLQTPQNIIPKLAARLHLASLVQKLHGSTPNLKRKSHPPPRLHILSFQPQKQKESSLSRLVVQTCVVMGLKNPRPAAPGPTEVQRATAQDPKRLTGYYLWIPNRNDGLPAPLNLPPNLLSLIGRLPTPSRSSA